MEPAKALFGGGQKIPIYRKNPHYEFNQIKSHKIYMSGRKTLNPTDPTLQNKCVKAV